MGATSEIPSTVGSRSSVLGDSAADSTRQKFTQKERDSESGLDYFLARYYSSAQGRFTSPDEFTGGPHEFWILGSGEPEDQALTYADITEPQSLNKYQYCLDNPLRYVDPDGHDPQDSDDKARRAAQGAAAHSGRTLTHDGRLRREYNRRAQELRGKPGASEARAALQKEIRQRSTPLGKGVADAAAKSREGQLAGKTAGQLAESASRTNKGWNKIGAVSEGVGKATLVVGVGISVYNVATAENKAEAVTEEAGAWGGALAGGAAGAKLGGAIGTVIEPGGGTAIGAGAGGVLGGIGGAIAGSKLGKAVYGWVERKVQDTLCSGCL